MPTITCNLQDLNMLAKTDFTKEDLEKNATIFKGEVENYNPATGEMKIELQDTNRPDLWCVEGIARQLRFKLTKDRPHYPWFNEPSSSNEMIIDPEMESIRPYAGGISIRGINVTEDVLVASIQTQEKLTDNLGHHRQSVSIGIYDLNQITFPVHYRAVERDAVKFVPLDFDTPMTPDQILNQHPKGIEYRKILDGCQKVPMLMDDNDTILSFPPIINSNQSGEVQTGQRDLFIEATGTNLIHVILALNIFAVNMADRGSQVEHIQVRYPYETPLGQTIQMPYKFDQSILLDTLRVKQWLGCEFNQETADQLLQEYGYETKLKDGKILCTMPSWRNDLLHRVDVIEDLAISAGYESFVPQMPKEYTVGNLDKMTLFSDRIRDIASAFGFEEVISNILCDSKEFKELMREPDRRIVEIANPMSANFAALRDRILPSLLRVERDSSSAPYPHNIFEAGEVTVHDGDTRSGCKTRHRLGLLVADKKAEFATVHSYLEILFANMKFESELKAEDSPAYIPGRSGKIYINEVMVGWIGELHPEVLENFAITMPAATFEIDLNEIYKIITGEAN